MDNLDVFKEFEADTEEARLSKLRRKQKQLLRQKQAQDKAEQRKELQ